MVLQIHTIEKKKAVGYIRVSTEEQAKEGISLDNQAASITAYCKAKEWDLTEIITDEGLSAKDLKREGVQKLIAMVKAKKFDMLIVYRLDRLTRSIRDLGYLTQDLFDKHDVAFSSIRESFDTSTATGRLMLNLIGCIAQWERETIAERTRDGLRYKKSKLERYGPVPFGFELDGKDLRPNKDELTIVDRIRDLRHRLRFSYRAIANRLNAEGVRTRAGRKWFASSIRVITNNEIYLNVEFFAQRNVT